MKIKANAKINLSLNICGKREDGYHLIDTVMHSVSLYDEIEIEKANEITIFCDNGDINGEKNIAYLAAVKFFKATNIVGGAEIKIKKQIPTAAGLGGGSADAAAVLVGLNKLYNANLSYDKLCEMAVTLGADVPFFIKGGCQRAEGIGEKLTVKNPLMNGYFVLAKGETKPSTAEMYKIIDSQPTFCVDTEAVIRSVENNDLNSLSECMGNAFETVWSESKIKQKLLSFSPLAVSLSGSGPTWFAFLKEKEDALNAFNTLKNDNIECYICTPQDKSIIFE